MEVEDRAEGGGPRQHRRADVEAAIQVEDRPDGGGPRLYRRAEVEAATQVEGEPEGDARDNTGGRR